MKKQRICQRCGESCGKTTNNKFCAKCIKSLPQCKSCGIICGASEWGYEVDENANVYISKKNGKEIILCGECEIILIKRGYLRLDHNRELRRDELVKKIELVTQVN